MPRYKKRHQTSDDYFIPDRLRDRRNSEFNNRERKEILFEANKIGMVKKSPMAQTYLEKPNAKTT